VFCRVCDLTAVRISRLAVRDAVALRSKSPLSQDQDPEISWKHNFQVMWCCADPRESCAFYLCKPCGRAEVSAASHWLSCLSLPSEWMFAKKDAFEAINRIRALQVERRKDEEEEEQENAEKEQEEKEQEEKAKDDNNGDTAQLEAKRSRNPSPTHSAADTSLPCASSLPRSSEDEQCVRVTPMAMTHSSEDSWQSRTSHIPVAHTRNGEGSASNGNDHRLKGMVIEMMRDLQDVPCMRASPGATTNTLASWWSPTSGPVHAAFRPVCEDMEQQNPDCLLERVESSRAQWGSAHARLHSLAEYCVQLSRQSANKN